MRKFILFVFVMGIYLVSNAQSLSKEQSLELISIGIERRHAEIKAKHGNEWESKVLINGDYKMKFDYKIFGEKPVDGRAMYISMHGGGGTTEENNNQQWENQKHLYTPAEGLYFVPRSPTNTWNMWHQGYMDGFIEKAIELAVIYEGVNPNKVYIMGYSAGGDGTYQLAPRLADLWAAAAMSAGHPGDAQAASLRNIPFAIYMGGKDYPYNRNGLAKEWSNKLDSLSSGDEGGYIHDVRIYRHHGHWMHRDDTVAIKWMSQFTRNPIPSKVVWVQDDVIRDNFYWLEATPDGKRQNERVVVRYIKNKIYIDEATPKSFVICLNDSMMNLDKPVSVYYNNKRIYKGKVERLKKNIENDIAKMRDQSLVFPVKLLCENGIIIQN